jgi:hypothetical protein
LRLTKSRKILFLFIDIYTLVALTVPCEYNSISGQEIFPSPQLNLFEVLPQGQVE